MFKINSFAGSYALKVSTGKQGFRVCIPFLNLESMCIDLETPTTVAKDPQNLLPQSFLVGGGTIFTALVVFTIPRHSLSTPYQSPQMMFLNGKYCCLTLQNLLLVML